MESRSLGLLLIGVGVVVLVVGLGIYAGVLGWFGRLPGDIRFSRGNTRVYFPLASMIVVSVVLSLVVSILRRLR